MESVRAASRRLRASPGTPAASASVLRGAGFMLLAFLMPVLVFSSACAARGSAGGSGGDEEASTAQVEERRDAEEIEVPPGSLVVAVQNRNFYEAFVVAESRQGQRRLGYVKGKRARAFVLDGGFSDNEFRVRVRNLERARECVQRYPGGAGQVIRIVLQENFERSPICF